MHGHDDCHTREADDERKYDSVPEGYTGMVYTCPMHHQVRSTKTKFYPLCGMGRRQSTWKRRIKVNSAT